MEINRELFECKSYVNGQFVDCQSDIALDVLDKNTGDVLASVDLLSENEFENVMDSVVSGADRMKSTSAQERSQVLLRIAEQIRVKFDEIVQIITLEAGKPIKYAKSEVNRCIRTVEMAASEALVFAGETVNVDYDAGQNKSAYTKPYPVGPIICITPFNFPLNLVLHKVAPAIAAGCSVVLKPAPQTPLSALVLAKIIHNSGLPVGAFNVVVCDNDLAQRFVEDDRFKMLSFTGSDQVGWKLKSLVPKKRCALELGGNASVMIDGGVDAASIVDTIAKGAFLYAGQICISTQRIIVHESVYDNFKEALLTSTKSIVSGVSTNQETINGPVISREHLDRIHSWVTQAIHEGANLLLGGQVFDETAHIYEPTVLENVSHDSTVFKEEVFGPVVILEKCTSFSQGLQMINQSKYGLQAGVYTNSIQHMSLAHDTLEVGGVIMNNVPGFRVDGMPYGGVKDSGVGREGIRYTLEEMSEMRLLVF